ncbi:MAG: hypothetical protein QMC85_05380 [Methanocellales archaeon]|nr:hypothetical protein [Methanocellales archaeon]
MDLDKEQIKSRVLEKMCRGKYFGGCHASVDDIKSGFPSHLRGKVPSIVDEMIKEGWLLPYRSKRELHVYLDPSKKEQIKAKIKEELSVDLFWI